jgi:putative transposase
MPSVEHRSHKGNLFVPARPYQFVLATHIHRLQSMAEWKAAAGVLA